MSDIGDPLAVIKHPVYSRSNSDLSSDLFSYIYIYTHVYIYIYIHIYIIMIIHYISHGSTYEWHLPMYNKKLSDDTLR